MSYKVGQTEKVRFDDASSLIPVRVKVWTSDFFFRSPFWEDADTDNAIRKLDLTEK
jgi:hypothetical protein